MNAVLKSHSPADCQIGRSRQRLAKCGISIAGEAVKHPNSQRLLAWTHSFSPQLTSQRRDFTKSLILAQDKRPLSFPYLQLKDENKVGEFASTLWLGVYY
jgi:hypothetical protein